MNFTKPVTKRKFYRIFNGQPELVKFPSTSEVFRAVFENTFYASCIGSGDGKTLEANETVCKVFGYSAAEITKLTTKELFVTTESKYVQYWHQLKSYGRAKAEITGIKKSGERFPCRISSLIFINDEGEKRTIYTILSLRKKYPLPLFD